MNNQTWNENEIAQAYERNFHLLEAARKEYEQSAFSLLDEITAKLNEQIAATSFDEGLKVEVTTSDQEFARRVVEWQLMTSDNFAPLRVLLRMATPWGGSPGCLQIAAAAYLDAKAVPQTLESLRTEADFKDIASGKPMKKIEPNWLHAVEVEIGSEIAADAAEYIVKLLLHLSPLASTINEERSFTESMRKSLGNVLQTFNSSPEFSIGWSFSPKLGWWQGMYYIQTNCDNRPSFWVGYRVETQSLMYGHHWWKDLPGFSKRFFIAANAKPPESYGGNPAGLIVEKEDLLNKPHEEIECIVADLFKLFYAEVNDSASSHAFADSGTATK
jgi:hypothetical protein